MKKTAASILILILTLNLAACAKTEKTGSDALSNSSASSTSSILSTSPSTSVDDTSTDESAVATTSSADVSSSSNGSADNISDILNVSNESSTGSTAQSQKRPMGTSKKSSADTPEAPPEDNPDEVYGIHDLSTGNYVYNPNVTDTSNERRYNADFEWTDESKTLWISEIDEKPWEAYDTDAAVAYGRAHWDDGVGLCAPFISRCITAGNITEYTESSTSITLQLLHSRLGFGQFVKYNKSDHTITLPEYARPGDVVQIYCSYEGVMIHSLLMVGTDEEGKLKVVCHNMRNSGTYTFHIDDLNDPCYDCASETVEVFFYHFYRDDDEGLPEEVVKNKNIMLWEKEAYVIPNEKYDREAALKFARENPEDGLGYYGASHTSDILQAGGISVGYPNQSAVFLQLLKSHLGTAYSQKIRDDRTVILPQNVQAGDIGFVYCPYDGMIYSSFIISGADSSGRMIAESYDSLNDGKSAYKVDSQCIGCGDDIKEVIIYHFDN